VNVEGKQSLWALPPFGEEKRKQELAIPAQALLPITEKRQLGRSGVGDKNPG
jgi:hypothetical protein